MTRVTQLQLFKPEKRDNRILVGLDVKTLDSLTRYAKAASKPRSRVVAEFIQMLEPVMSEYADRLEELQRLGDLETFKRGLEGVTGRLRMILEGEGHEV